MIFFRLLFRKNNMTGFLHFYSSRKSSKSKIFLWRMRNWASQEFAKKISNHFKDFRKMQFQIFGEDCWTRWTTEAAEWVFLRLHGRLRWRMATLLWTGSSQAWTTKSIDYLIPLIKSTNLSNWVKVTRIFGYVRVNVLDF